MSPKQYVSAKLRLGTNHPKNIGKAEALPPEQSLRFNRQALIVALGAPNQSQ